MKTKLFTLLLIIPFFLVKSQFSYSILSTIDNTPQTLNKQVNFESNDLEDLIEESLEITKDDLSFSLKSSGNSNVNTLLKTKKAHCVGYANYFNSVLQQLIRKNKLKDIKISHVRAKVSFIGINLHIIDAKEFKDHDICVVYDLKNNKKYYVDPSLSEIFGNIVNEE